MAVLDSAVSAGGSLEAAGSSVEGIEGGGVAEAGFATAGAGAGAGERAGGRAGAGAGAGTFCFLPPLPFPQLQQMQRKTKPPMRPPAHGGKPPLCFFLEELKYPARRI